MFSIITLAQSWEIRLMATREQRLAEFSTESPAADVQHELLCEDHAGTYALKFPCAWNGTAWLNGNTGLEIAAQVIGWRAWEPQVHNSCPT